MGGGGNLYFRQYCECIVCNSLANCIALNMTLIVYSKYYRWENHYKFPHFAGKKTEARMPFNFLHETGRLHPCSFVFADLKCFPVGSSPVCHCCLIRCPFCQSLGLFCHRKRIKDLFLALRKQPLYNLWSFELMQAPCQLLIDLYSILGCASSVHTTLTRNDKMYNWLPCEILLFFLLQRTICGQLCRLEAFNGQLPTDYQKKLMNKES